MALNRNFENQILRQSPADAAQGAISDRLEQKISSLKQQTEVSLAPPEAEAQFEEAA